MKLIKILFVSFCISIGAHAAAQQTAPQSKNINISLFQDEDEEQPQLGIHAPALNQLHVAPPPLPDITIDLTTPTPTPPPTTTEPEPAPEPSAVINLPDSSTPTTPPGTPAAPTSHVMPHNVRDFAVQGFALGMSLRDVLEQAERLGYTVKQVREDIPRFYAFDYELKCQKQGVITPQDIRDCIRGMARTEGQAYTAQVDIVRGKKELFSFLFTSHHASNEVYKITYYNYGDNSLNFTKVNTAKKLQRQKEFWNAVYKTYGHPDDAQKMIWGDPQKAYMQAKMFGTAYNAMISLTDVKAYSRDYFYAEDIEKERPPKNDFVFSM